MNWSEYSIRQRSSWTLLNWATPGVIACHWWRFSLWIEGIPFWFQPRAKANALFCSQSSLIDRIWAWQSLRQRRCSSGRANGTLRNALQTPTPCDRKRGLRAWPQCRTQRQPTNGRLSFKSLSNLFQLFWFGRVFLCFSSIFKQGTVNHVESLIIVGPLCWYTIHYKNQQHFSRFGLTRGAHWNIHLYALAAHDSKESSLQCTVISTCMWAKAYARHSAEFRFCKIPVLVTQVRRWTMVAAFLWPSLGYRLQQMADPQLCCSQAASCSAVVPGSTSSQVDRYCLGPLGLMKLKSLLVTYAFEICQVYLKK